MSWFSDAGGSFGINLGINPAEWFGEDRPDEVRAQAREQAERDYARQKEFAQNSIRWKVDDAKAAGLHPLFGLSSNAATFSPSAVVGYSGGGESSIGFTPGAPSGARRASESRQAQPGTDNFERTLLERQANNEHARTVSSIATDTEQQSLYRAQTEWTREQIEASRAARTGQLGRANKEAAIASPDPVMHPQDAYEVEVRPYRSGTESSGHSIGVGPPSAAWEPVWVAPGIPALVPVGAGSELGDMEFSGWLASIVATAAWWGHASAQKVWELAKKAGHHVSWSEVEKRLEKFDRNSLTTP